MVLEPGIHTTIYIWCHHIDITEPTRHINIFTGHRINGILCYLVMRHDSAWTTQTGAWDVTIEEMNVIVMLVYLKETILEVQVWWYGVPYHSMDVLNWSAFKAIWQDKDITTRFWHLLWFQFFNSNRNITLFQQDSAGVTQHVCQWDIWMSNMSVCCHGWHSSHIFPNWTFVGCSW